MIITPSQARPLYICAVLLLSVACTNNRAATDIQSVPKQTTSSIVGGGCDGCELMFEGMPATMNETDTSAGWLEGGQQLVVKGHVYDLDGRTPAQGVIIYYWQTDRSGYYSPVATQSASTKRHGHIRGWMKTDQTGAYTLYTSRPAPYPNDVMPAHIHIAIKEPAIANEYYIDELVFEDDVLLTEAKRKALENRGGSGILHTELLNSVQYAGHDIVLGLHVPGYPTETK